MENQVLALLKEMNSKLDTVVEKVDKLEAKVDKLEAKVDKLEAKVDKLETKVDRIEIQQAEHTQILRALEAAKDVHAAKLDNIETNIAYIQGDIKALRNDLNLVEEVTSKNWNEITRLKKMHQQ
ncbi:MAG: DUF5798 family protein [Paraclostridium sp.]